MSNLRGIGRSIPWLKLVSVRAQSDPLRLTTWLECGASIRTNLMLYMERQPLTVFVVDATEATRLIVPVVKVVVMRVVVDEAMRLTVTKTETAITKYKLFLARFIILYCA